MQCNFCNNKIDKHDKECPSCGSINPYYEEEKRINHKEIDPIKASMLLVYPIIIFIVLLLFVSIIRQFFVGF